VSLAVQALCVATALGAVPRTSWVGTYTVEDTDGQHVIDYRIDVVEVGSHLRTTIRANGFQTHETVLATAEEKDHALLLHFRSYAGGKLENAYGVAVYRPGDELLRIQATGSGASRTLHVVWGKLLHDSPAPTETARYSAP
jgi:hypothetical protein